MTKDRDLELYRGDGFRGQEPQDIDTDFEFVPEDAENPLFKPEWHVFLYYGQNKFDEATQHLQFVELRDGLYHYVDRRDDQRYSMPEESRVKSHLKERRRVEVQNWAIDRRMRWAAGIYLFVLLVGFPVLCGTVFHPNVSDGVGAWFGLLFAGSLVLWVSWLKIRHWAPPLPDFRMFITDAEIAEEERRLAELERRRQARAALYAALGAAWAANEYRKHNNRQLAEEIAKAQQRHRW